MTIEDIRRMLPKAWTPREDWRKTDLFKNDEPSVGQCAVTALVVQDYLGGEIVKVDAYSPTRPEIEKASHYFNIVDKKRVDLTGQQFNSDVIFSEPYQIPNGFSSMRDYALSYTDTVKRYELLKAKVNDLLKA